MQLVVPVIEVVDRHLVAWAHAKYASRMKSQAETLGDGDAPQAEASGGTMSSSAITAT